MKLLMFVIFLYFVPCYCTPSKRPDRTFLDCAKITLQKRPGSGDTNLNLSDPRLINNNLPLLVNTSYARHHVIPYNRIRDFFYNTLGRNDDVTRNACSTLFDIMNYITEHVSMMSGTIYSDIEAEDMRHNFVVELILSTNMEARRRLIPAANDPVRLLRHIHVFFVWFEPNIFLGPSDRSDDPGSEFETNAVYIVGQSRFNILVELNDIMRTFNSNTNLEDEERYRLINQAVHLFKSLLTYQTVSFNPRNWILTETTNKKGRVSRSWRINTEFLNEEIEYEDNDTTTANPTTANPELRRKRQIDTSKICLYENVEKQVKGWWTNNTCLSRNPYCGCV